METREDQLPSQGIIPTAGLFIPYNGFCKAGSKGCTAASRCRDGRSGAARGRLPRSRADSGDVLPGSPGRFPNTGKALDAKPDHRAWEITAVLMLPFPRQGAAPAPGLLPMGWAGLLEESGAACGTLPRDPGVILHLFQPPCIASSPEP